MKRITVALSLAMLLSVPLSASAVALINKTVILEAQDYGIKRSQQPLTEFLRPWLAYEEQAAIINETTERAYLYSPFLLIAYDARDKAINKNPVQLADSEKILADYAGCMVFSVTLTGNPENFSDTIQFIIKQDKKIIKPYHAVTNPPVKTSGSANQQVIAYSYVYFHERDVSMEKPVMLVASAQDKQEHRFYFDLPSFK